MKEHDGGTMNEELLKQIEACAPKGMGADFDYIGGAGVAFEGVRDGIETVAYVGEVPDGFDQDLYCAAGIIAMLNAMEAAGFWLSVYKHEANLYICEHDMTALPDWWVAKHGPTLTATGATRTEAVCKAFVAVFGERAVDRVAADQEVDRR